MLSSSFLCRDMYIFVTFSHRILIYPLGTASKLNFRWTFQTLSILREGAEQRSVLHVACQTWWTNPKDEITGLTKLSALYCYVLYLSVVFILLYMPVFMQFGSVFVACNTTENIELYYRPMITLDWTSVCNKGLYVQLASCGRLNYVWMYFERPANVQFRCCAQLIIA